MYSPKLSPVEVVAAEVPNEIFGTAVLVVVVVPKLNDEVVELGIVLLKFNAKVGAVEVVAGAPSKPVLGLVPNDSPVEGATVDGVPKDSAVDVV